LSVDNKRWGEMEFGARGDAIIYTRRDSRTWGNRGLVVTFSARPVWGCRIYPDAGSPASWAKSTVPGGATFIQPLGDAVV